MKALVQMLKLLGGRWAARVGFERRSVTQYEIYYFLPLVSLTELLKPLAFPE